MIVAYINPQGVERIYFYGDSELNEKLCLAAWPLIRRELKRLDEQLKEVISGAIEAAEKEVTRDG